MSIVKSSVIIREALKKRFEELNLSQADVCREADERKFKIERASMSKYFKNNAKASLTEEQIIWLCLRYGIPISLTVGALVIDGERKFKSVMPIYNEERALAMLSTIYGKK